MKKMQSKFKKCIVIGLSLILVCSMLFSCKKNENEDVPEIEEATKYVIYLDNDGTLLQKTEFKEGEKVPEYDGKVLDKTLNGLTYTFDKWKKIDSEEEDNLAVYIATYVYPNIEDYETEKYITVEKIVEKEKIVYRDKPDDGDDPDDNDERYMVTEEELNLAFTHSQYKKFTAKQIYYLGNDIDIYRGQFDGERFYTCIESLNHEIWFDGKYEYTHVGAFDDWFKDDSSKEEMYEEIDAYFSALKCPNGYTYDEKNKWYVGYDEFEEEHLKYIVQFKDKKLVRATVYYLTKGEYVLYVDLDIDTSKNVQKVVIPEHDWCVK